MKKIISFDVLSPLLIGLMWTWPFLYPAHRLPITTFYQEWGAVLLGFSAGSWMLLKSDFWREAEIPRIVLLPLGLAAIVVIQFALGMLPYFEQTLLVSLYFLWAALLMATGNYLRRKAGLPHLALVLATFLAAGGELNALAGILQHFNWHTFLDPYLTPKLSVQIYGNIAQPNHYADYVMLSMVSILYLHDRRRINGVTAVTLVVPLLFVLALCGSRSTWMYIAAIAGLGYLFRGNGASPPLKFFLWILLGFLLMNGIAELPWLTSGTAESLTPLDRMFAEVKSVGSVGGSVNSGAIRLYLWREAARMFLHFPLAGIGFGQYAWQHFKMLPAMHAPDIQGLYNNAHNLVFMIAAETGLAGLLVLFGTLAPWIRNACKYRPTPEAWWGYSLLSILLVHSLLEYPLWYAYFLGIAAFLLGMFDGTRFALRPRILYRIPAYIVLVFGLASIQQLYENYSRLEYILADRPARADDAEYMRRIWQNLAFVQQESVFRPYAELFAGLAMDSAPASIRNKLDLCERVIRFSPNESLAYKYALLLALNGKHSEAATEAERAIWSYPLGFSTFRTQLVFLDRADPMDFASLLSKSDEAYAARSGQKATKGPEPAGVIAPLKAK